MKQKEVKLYSINELDDEAFRNAVDNNRDINVRWEEWYHFMLDDWKAKLAIRGYENAEINFSGFHSQGDGASFTADINVEKMDVSDELVEAYQRGGVELSVVRKKHAPYCHYVHENTTYVDSYVYNGHGSDVSDSVVEEVNELANSLEEEREQLSKEIYRDLRDEYTRLQDEEEVVSTMEHNNMLFFSDGNIAPHQVTQA